MRSHELLLLRVYIAPAAEIVDKLCAQVAGFINLMFLGFLSPYDSYESPQVSYGIPSPYVCSYASYKKLCEGSPQVQSNPTLAGRNLYKMVPLTMHGDGTPVCGAGKSWSKMGDFFSCKCLMFLMCLVSYVSMCLMNLMILMCLLFLMCLVFLMCLMCLVSCALV